MNELERTQIVYAPIEKAFAYFSDPHNLAALTPAWMRFQVDRMPGDEIFGGCEIDYTIRWLRVPIRWTTTITEYERDVRFVDEQKRGPYKRWWHEHRFERVSDDITRMTDRVVYEMPLGPLGRAVHTVVVRRQLAEILRFRATVIDRLFPHPRPQRQWPISCPQHRSGEGGSMIVTTTAVVEGRPVREYLGVVAGETVLGANVFRDIGAQFRNITGGRSGGYEKELRKGRDTALDEMAQAAAELGADAVVGVDLDYETVGGAMLMVTAAGTAVKLAS